VRSWADQERTEDKIALIVAMVAVNAGVFGLWALATWLLGLPTR
jgi:hypothetical protein